MCLYDVFCGSIMLNINRSLKVIFKVPLFQCHTLTWSLLTINDLNDCIRRGHTDLTIPQISENLPEYISRGESWCFEHIKCIPYNIIPVKVYPGYFQEPHYKLMGLLEISRANLDQGVQPWALTKFPDFSLTFPWPFCGFPWPWDILAAFHYCHNTNFASNLTNHSPKVAITK